MSNSISTVQGTNYWTVTLSSMQTHNVIIWVSPTAVITQTEPDRHTDIVGICKQPQKYNTVLTECAYNMALYVTARHVAGRWQNRDRSKGKKEGKETNNTKSADRLTFILLRQGIRFFRDSSCYKANTHIFYYSKQINNYYTLRLKNNSILFVLSTRCLKKSPVS